MAQKSKKKTKKSPPGCSPKILPVGPIDRKWKWSGNKQHHDGSLGGPAATTADFRRSDSWNREEPGEKYRASPDGYELFRERVIQFFASGYQTEAID